MKTITAILVVCLTALPGLAKTHKDMYSVSCNTLWPVVKDVIKNSGKYTLVSIDNSEMTASYIIGSSFSGRRLNSVILNVKEDKCEMQTASTYSGVTHDDAGDFKKRVDASLAKSEPPATSTSPTKPDSK